MITHDTYLISVAYPVDDMIFMFSFYAELKHKYYDDEEFATWLEEQVEKKMSTAKKEGLASNYTILSVTNLTKIKPVRDN